MRLIDAYAVAEAVKDEITEAKGIDADPYFVLGLKLGLAYINTAETVDAELVVRCRDCKHYENYAENECDINGAMSSDVGYCSYGERRDEDYE